MTWPSWRSGPDSHPGLALLTVLVKGGVPVIRGFAREVRNGEPVAMLGYPFGLDFPVGVDWRTAGVRISRFSGTARNGGPGRLEIDGYGVSGSSGSPAGSAPETIDQAADPRVPVTLDAS